MFTTTTRRPGTNVKPIATALILKVVLVAIATSRRGIVKVRGTHPSTAFVNVYSTQHQLLTVRQFTIIIMSVGSSGDI